MPKFLQPGPFAAVSAAAGRLRALQRPARHRPFRGLRDWLPEDDLAHFAIEAVERTHKS